MLLEAGIKPRRESAHAGQTIICEQVDEAFGGELVVSRIELAVLVEVEEAEEIMLDFGVVDGEVAKLDSTDTTTNAAPTPTTTLFAATFAARPEQKPRTPETVAAPPMLEKLPDANAKDGESSPPPRRSN
eukprot:CAMPEP_0119427614 /NCGR_PEP_ID=MMETSP1335-20130426/38721_1 /TAXON_ID=259385 /ORGANISM="Chrysoculter rhomboideus, Strain RCC1486" /LENGTH=129 /DNA_ID=CAMNT_0007453257 /DNA_START=219 /DNA_END=606 /DNA_ORIENTATION=-